MERPAGRRAWGSALQAALGVVAVAGWLVPAGCGVDPGRPVIDFSETEPAVIEPADHFQGQEPLRGAVAGMVSPGETFRHYQELFTYLGARLGRPVQLVQRRTYREINALLGEGRIDFAFICSGPYVRGKDRYGFTLLGTPEIRGRHTYRAYLVVHADSPFQNLEDLKGHTFAFTDPESNSGRLVVLYWLGRMHSRPGAFFKKIIYTHSHDNAVLAVSRRLIDGATVDGLIYEFYRRKHLGLTAATRVIQRSQPFGIPPVAASRFLETAERERLQAVLFSMHTDPRGREILDSLMIDRFVPGQDAWYDGIREMLRSIDAAENTDAPEKSQG